MNSFKSQAYKLFQKSKQGGKYLLKQLWRLIAFTVRKMYTVAIVTLAIVLSISIGIGISIANAVDSQDKDKPEFSDDTELRYEFYEGDEKADTKIARLKLRGGIIAEAAPTSFLNTSQVISGSQVQEILERLAEDEDIKGVLLDFNSPGGSPVGSAMIADGIEYYQEQTGQPVVVHTHRVLASGGVWSSVPANQIIARSEALIGSVGVAFGSNPIITVEGITKYGTLNIGGESKQYEGEDIKVENLFKGKFKRAKNPLNMTEEEKQKKYINFLEDSYNRFVSHVVEHRDISENRLRNELGARIFPAKKAKEVNYIDKTGNQREALQYMYNQVNDGEEALVLNAKLRDASDNSLANLLNFSMGDKRSQSEMSPVEKRRFVQNLSICSRNAVLMSYGDSIQNFCQSYAKQGN